MRRTAILLALSAILTAGCSGDGIDVTVTYMGDTFEPTSGVAVDSTPIGDAAIKSMVIALSTAPMSCSFTLEDKEDLPAGKYLFISVFTQDAGEALPAFHSVIISTGPDDPQKGTSFETDDIKLNISNVGDGRVEGELSASGEIKDADGMVVGTASAEGSFDVERCF